MTLSEVTKRLTVPLTYASLYILSIGKQVIQLANMIKTKAVIRSVPAFVGKGLHIAKIGLICVSVALAILGGYVAVNAELRNTVIDYVQDPSSLKAE